MAQHSRAACPRVLAASVAPGTLSDPNLFSEAAGPPGAVVSEPLPMAPDFTCWLLLATKTQASLEGFVLVESEVLGCGPGECVNNLPL